MAEYASTAAAARAAAESLPDGALAVMMEFVAIAPDEIVEEEICSSIYSLCLVGPKFGGPLPPGKTRILDRQMVKALSDQHPTRRAIAALIVGRFGDPEERQAVTRSLKDEVAVVRRGGPGGLIGAGDKSGVPVLVEMLAAAPLSLALQCECLLNSIAGEKSPSAPLDENKENRQKCHVAWNNWWDKNKDSLDLTKVEIDSPFAWHGHNC